MKKLHLQFRIGLMLLLCGACNTQYQSQKTVYNNRYVEIEREIGRTVYDFFWAFSQEKTVQAELYTTPKGWRSVTKLKNGPIRGYNVERIVLSGKQAEVEVVINNQQYTKLFLTIENSEWMIYDAMPVSSLISKRATKTNKNNNKKDTYTPRKRENTSSRKSAHLVKQSLINQGANAFFSALSNKDISTAEQYATAGGLESVMTLPIDYIHKYEIENIILYGNIADVEMLVNGKIKTLAIMVEERGKWLVDRTQTNYR